MSIASVAEARRSTKKKAPERGGLPSKSNAPDQALVQPDGKSVAATLSNGQAKSGKGPAAGPDLPALQAKLAAARAALKKIEYTSSMGWDKRNQKVAELNEEIAGIEQQIATAEVKALPAAAKLSDSKLAFEEWEVDVASIVITGNHREDDSDVETEQLARTIDALGLLQRVGVRDLGDGKFELILGSRRLKAVKSLGWKTIPAKIYSRALTPAEVEVIRTVENFGRRELSPVEKAIAVARVIEAVEKDLQPLKSHQSQIHGEPGPELREFADSIDFDKFFAHDPRMATAVKVSRLIRAAGGLHAYVGQQLGFPAKWVKDNDYIAKLGGEARKLLSSRRIDVGHARELAKLGDPAGADAIARDVARNEKGLGGRDVDYVRNRVNERLMSLRSVPWRLDVAFGKDEKAGCAGNACQTCPFNSKTDPDLFQGSLTDEPDNGFCTNRRCFDAKGAATEKLMVEFVKRATTEVKRHGVGLTERGLAHLIPPQIRASSAVRRAKKEIDPETGKKAVKPGRSQHPPIGGHKATPAELARQKHRDAVQKWADKTAKTIDGCLDAVPGRRLAFELLTQSRDWQDVHLPWNWEDGQAVAAITKAEKNSSNDKFRAMLKLLKAPDFSALISLNDRVQSNQEVDGYDIKRLAGGVFDPLAETLGIQIEPAPQLHTFLDAAKTEKVAAPAGAKKSSKKKSAAEDVDDASDLDDREEVDDE